MKHLSVVSLLLACLASAAEAQRLELAGQPTPRVLGGTGTLAPPRLHVVHDVWSGRTTVRSLATPQGAELALGTPCFDNSDQLVPDDPQYVVANIGEELLDWGVKDCNGAGLIESFTIRYRSGAVDPSLGGPGAALSVALFRDSRGFGVPGFELFRRTLTGLPARISSVPSVLLTFDFGDHPLRLQDGRIGWSVMQLDGQTGPELVRAPRPELGTIDALDLYAGPAAAGNYVGTFNYGGCAAPGFGPCASLWLQIEEIDESELASSTSVNGSGANPNVLSELQPARLGQVWAMHFDLTGFPGTTSTNLFVSLGGTLPIPTPVGELLIAPGQILRPPLSANGTHLVAIPFDLSLAGIVLHTQGALRSPGSLLLTNGLVVTLGF